MQLYYIIYLSPFQPPIIPVLPLYVDYSSALEYNRDMIPKKAALVLNAPELNPDLITEEYIVAADAGFRHVRDKKVAALIGDLDTLGKAPKGINLIRFPVEKNATDGELAIDYLHEQGCRLLTIYGAFGGKIEHIIGNLNLLAYADSLGISAHINDGNMSAYFCRNYIEIPSVKGDEVSIFPFGGNAVAARSEGLYYPLNDLTLDSKKSRGISNRATADKIVLQISEGAVMILLRRAKTV